MDSPATGFRGPAEWAAPALKDLLPDLSREEQLWLENGFQPAGRKRKGRRITKQKLLPEVPPSMPAQRTQGERDAWLIGSVQAALCHYNARHQGGEFDAVKPLMEDRVGFRDQVWFHLNFWARSRSTNKIKRFFAEVHYKPSSDTSKYPRATPIVEICTIIEEPLSQYRRACAFCAASFEILHPKGCRKFVCGNDKDRFEQRLVRCGSMCIEPPFSCPSKIERQGLPYRSSSSSPSQ
ncbi:hypothetical protein QYE76_013535 [Lolium multiflorum]|uniref:DUF3615 domain-containing protein n=1 Tax=Lolium multiflorum TaxID=4521 RepID=A0AAD8U359_LOLMU|nr:hypothetical protein QYE76_013535 [Lolium multiflorum]